MIRIETRPNKGQGLPPPSPQEREAAESLGGGRKAMAVIVTPLSYDQYRDLVASSGLVLVGEGESNQTPRTTH